MLGGTLSVSGSEDIGNEGNAAFTQISGNNFVNGTNSFQGLFVGHVVQRLHALRLEQVEQPEDGQVVAGADQEGEGVVHGAQPCQIVRLPEELGQQNGVT